MEVEARLIDFEKVERAIANLNDIDKNKVVREGLKQATDLFIKAGKQNLQSRMKNKKGDTGNLLKSFRNKVKRNKLGAIAGFNQLGNHSWLIDRGTIERTNSKGQNRGKIIGNKFWDDAIEQNQSTAIERVYSGIERAIINIMNK